MLQCLTVTGDVVRSSAFHLSEMVGSILATGLMWKESVNALLKVVDYLRALQLPPTGQVGRVA
jgi:hypothetical protein